MPSMQTPMDTSSPGLPSRLDLHARILPGRRFDGYDDYIGSEAFLAREYSARLAVIRTYQPRGLLFEIGCASGEFLQQARRYYSVYGVDVSDFAVRVARLRVTVSHATQSTSLTRRIRSATIRPTVLSPTLPSLDPHLLSRHGSRAELGKTPVADLRDSLEPLAPMLPER
jgi:hypothetical protein